MHRKVPVSLLSLFLIVGPSLAIASDTAVCNANHIFNAIHSSMRQWGGSLNHNGMSLFLATVPEGTQLYHGTSEEKAIEGMQWLAFEPEHALIFAHPRGGRGGPPPGNGEGPPPPGGRWNAAEEMQHGGEEREHHEPPYGNGPGDEREDWPPSPPSHDEHHEQPPPPRPPPPHERTPCKNTVGSLSPPHHRYGPSPPDYQDETRKHRGHGPPPPLPPGHIYKPYPPPPRSDRPHKGPKRPWDSEHRRPPPPDHFDRHGLPQDHHDDLPNAHRPLPKPQHEHEHDETIELRSTRKRQTQQPLRESPPQQSAQKPPQEKYTGYLHTYAPMHDLHLLYIDGLSAGKTSNGTLDTQDLLLLNLTAGDPGHGGPMGGEMARAEGLCELASTLWEGKVDGFLRLEGGFEIILCEFEKHLHRVDNVRVSPDEQGRRGVMGGFEYLKAITSRYHGIGGGRVKVDYNDFVSVFQYDGDAVRGLWDNDVHSDVRMPRLTNVAPSTLQSLRDDVTSLVHSKDWAKHDRTTDWQAIADMIVARYSTPLHHLTHTPSLRTNKEELTSYLSSLLRPFIDAGARNATLETSRCMAQFLPPLYTLPTPPGSLSPLAHRALSAVTSRICDTLFTSLSIASSTTSHITYSASYAAHGVEVLDELVAWLAWTSWKECGACGDEEVCFIPIWPMGTAQDHAKPRCRGADGVNGRSGYWGRMGPPRGDGKE